MTRKTTTFSVEIARPTVENEFEASILAPGVHNGWTFLAEEIARAAESFEGQPVNLDHSRAIEDEVGYLKNVKVVEGRLKATIVLSPETAKFAVARAFIENRQRANKTPEVSVGVSFTVEEMHREDGDPIFIARDLEGDHLALVTRGACSPDKGCGVGLALKENTNMESENPDNKTPAAPPAEGTPPAETASTEAAKPCGCHELEKALLSTKAEKDKVSADLAAETKSRSEAEKALAEFKAALPERIALLRKAEDFGLETPADVDLASLRADLAKAEKVAAHLAAKPATGPAPAPKPGSLTRSGADAVGQKAAALLAAGGLRVA